MKFNLYIDTTNKTCMFSLFDLKMNLISESLTPTNNDLVDKAVEILDSFLEENNTSYENINNIYLNLGPGSFTGVRVGVNIAKTIWMIHNDINILTSNNLELISEFNGFVSLDAKSNKFYIAKYENNKTIIEPKMISLEELEDIKKNNEIINGDLISDIDKFRDSYKLLNKFKKEKQSEVIPLYIKPAVI